MIPQLEAQERLARIEDAHPPLNLLHRLIWTATDDREYADSVIRRILIERSIKSALSDK